MINEQLPWTLTPLGRAGYTVMRNSEKEASGLCEF